MGSLVIMCLPALMAALAAEPYQNPDLPPLMEFLDGTPVRTMEDFERRRTEIRELLLEYFLGEFPKEPPALISAEALEEHAADGGSVRRRIKLTFDTPNRASFEVWVWTPPGDGPFPLLLTQPRFYQIYWAEDAVKRGYIACLYPGLDVHHTEADYPGYETVWQTFRDEYPQATWASSLAIQAWLASRALDYLLDPAYGCNVAEGQVGIIGFSRYGKQSLYAAAFDERITSVVARSSGSPTAVGYRFAGRNTFMETVEDFPAPWALASLRSFMGRENELPIEGHGLLALIAPRRCMFHTAYNDGGDPTFGVERTYLQGREVYRFLGKPENLRNMYRPGNHESGPEPDYVTEPHRSQNLDWFDLSFGRGTAKPSDFPEVLLHQFDWQAWRANQDDEDMTSLFPATPATGSADRRARIRWALGTPPAEVEGEGEYHIRTVEELGVPDSSRDRWACPDAARMPVSFSGRIHGNIYYNPSVTEPAPAVIWLHPYNYSHGSNEGYGVEDTTVYHRLAQAGFVVLAYDQCGFGDRLLEGPGFYDRYPGWSRLGRMVHDVSAAIDFLIDGRGEAQGNMPLVDPQQVYALGYSMGGMVGLYAAAMDERITGVASFCGFTPLRTDTDDRPTGGIRRLWEWHALQPKLGLFDGREGDIPYDFDDVLALIAPRPCLIYAPRRDREANINDVVAHDVVAHDVVACVERASVAWADAGRASALTLRTPDDINRFQRDQQIVGLEWLQDATIARRAKLAPITDKTLVAWVRLANAEQRGGSALTLFDASERFDAIVFGEVEPKRWMAGSDFFKRTPQDQSGWPEETAGPDELVQVAVSYEGRMATIYRNAEEVASYEVDEAQPFATDATVLIGLRYLGAMGAIGPLAGEVEEARIYDTPLSREQIAGLKLGEVSDLAPVGWWTFENGSTEDKAALSPPGRLHGGATIADGVLRLNGVDAFMACRIEYPENQLMFYKALNPSTGNMWDTWLYWRDGTYYLYYLANQTSSWDNISMARSTDGVHWEELGPVLRKSEGVDWMGTGSTWAAPQGSERGPFIMNFSEWRGDRQTIFLAESSDLVHWERLGEDYEFEQDTRWYEEKGRWDCIYTIPRPEGGLFGYWTANPAGRPGVGFGRSDDGATWEALEPPVFAEGSPQGEAGAVERLQVSYYLMLGAEGGMRTMVSERPEGPFAPALRNYDLLAGQSGMHTYFARFFPTPDGVLVNHHSRARDGQVYFAPLKRAVVDAEGTLRLGWWEGNDALKEADGSRGPGYFDPSTGAIIEGRLEIPAPGEAEPGIAIGLLDGGHVAILVGPNGVTRIGPAQPDGSEMQVEERIDREMSFPESATFKLLIKHSLIEFYLEDILIQAYSLPVRASGTLRWIGAAMELR